MVELCLSTTDILAKAKCDDELNLTLVPLGILIKASVATRNARTERKRGTI
jgi:hypothetical protein